MIIIIYSLILLAIALISLGVLIPKKEITMRGKLSFAVNYTRKESAPLVLLKIIPFTDRILQRFKLSAKIKNRLDAARIHLSPQEFFNLKLLIMIGLAGLSALVLGAVEPLGIIGGLILGYLAPDFWLKQKIAKRKYKIARVLPETVDLLGLCVEAGLDFTTAVNWVTGKGSDNLMVEELKFVLEEIRWGKTRIQALKDMAERLNVQEITSFVHILVQAERMGTPVSEAFILLSEDMRMQRFHRGERYAMKAPIKILIPLVFCILPVIAIIIGGPILLQFMQGGILGKF